MVEQKFIITFLLIIISNVIVIKAEILQSAASSSCSNPNGRTGECIPIENCESLMNIVKNKQTSAFEFLRKSVCRPNGQINRYSVCCTSDTGFDSIDDRIVFPHDYDDEKVDRSTTTRIPEENENSPSRCTNPNGRTGDCVPIYGCESLLHAAKTNRTSAFEFVRKSQCKSNVRTRQPYVCCTGDVDFEPLLGRISAGSTTNAIFETPVSSLFPKPPQCGPLFISNRIAGGSEAERGEFPWLALLEHKLHNGDIFSTCSGSIINQRYILTAAYCASVGQLISIRVGVHNKTTKVDCKNSECSDGSHRFGIENVILHKDYNISDAYYYHNDIALIRMNQNIEFNNLVAPICLPNVIPQIPHLSRGVKLTVAGWGLTENDTYSDVKRQVELPYVECDNRFFKVAPDQLCAGGEFGKDNCKGDSGGSLIRLVGASWVAEGIVSFGLGCGTEIPSVYTRVSSYIHWIYENVQP